MMLFSLLIAISKTATASSIFCQWQTHYETKKISLAVYYVSGEKLSCKIILSHRTYTWIYFSAKQRASFPACPRTLQSDNQYLGYISRTFKPQYTHDRFCSIDNLEETDHCYYLRMPDWRHSVEKVLRIPIRFWNVPIRIDPSLPLIVPDNKPYVNHTADADARLYRENEE